MAPHYGILAWRVPWTEEPCGLPSVGSPRVGHDWSDLAAAVCKSLQHLTYALTQGGEGGHLFRLICSIVLQGGRNTANKYHWCVWGVLTVFQPHWVFPAHCVCIFMVYTSQALDCSSGNCLRRALGCVHFPSLSHSGSGSWVHPKGADSVGPVFCALPRSEQLRWPGAWEGQSSLGGLGILSPPLSQLLGFLGVQWACLLRCAVCLFWGADLRLWPSGQMSTIQNPKNSWLAMEPVCSVVEDASLGPQLPVSSYGCPLPACIQWGMDQPAAY